MKVEPGARTAAAPQPHRDRSRPPPLRTPPALRPPTIERDRLANGLAVLVSPRRGVPLVELELIVRGGSAADPRGMAGRASLTADLLNEGTERRSGLEIAEAVDQLGATVYARAGWDECAIGLHIVSTRLDDGLDLLAEMLLFPAFAPEEVERRRQVRLNALLQERDEPAATASRTFHGVVYGTDHAYGTPPRGTRSSMASLDREALVACYRNHYHPGVAYLAAAGDVPVERFLARVESVLGAWPDVQAAAAPATAATVPKPTAFHVVDRPDAPQSELRIGHAGPPRDTPDYAPLQLMNTVLGGAFTSRINTRLREEKGYTYGARSGFGWRVGPGTFAVGAAVFADATADAVATVLEELRRIRDEPIPATELERARRYLVLGLPRRLESAAGLAAHLTDIALYGLGDDYFARLTSELEAVTAADVRRAAAAYLDPDHTQIIIVGDRARIEPALAALDAGPVFDHDPERS